MGSLLACKQRPGVRVEISDELVPGGNLCLELRPECGVHTAVECSGRHPLLLDPRVVAEVEYPPPVDMRQFDQVIVGDALQMMPENFAGVDFVETAGILAREILLALAVVERRAVRRDGDDDI